MALLQTPFRGQSYQWMVQHYEQAPIFYNNNKCFMIQKRNVNLYLMSFFIARYYVYFSFTYIRKARSCGACIFSFPLPPLCALARFTFAVLLVPHTIYSLLFVVWIFLSTLWPTPREDEGFVVMWPDRIHSTLACYLSQTSHRCAFFYSIGCSNR